MKRRNVFILIILLAIGFAAVSTTLVINGNLNVGYNNEDFDKSVIYTRAHTSDGTAVINQDGKNIDFESIKLENVNQKVNLEFDVTNKNRNYDANVTIKCGLKDEFASFDEYLSIKTDITSPFDLMAGNSKTGNLTVEMTKAYDKALETTVEVSCELIASPVERDTLGDEYVDTYSEKLLKGADPVLGTDLLPITIADDGTVTYADTDRKWYSYEDKEWANAVMLVDSPSKEYNVNDVISEEDIKSYFVWIPRYRYQIFAVDNYSDVIEENTTTSNAQEIQIEFESKNIDASTGSTKGSWLTHPAFTNFDVNGIWIGKFETTGSIDNMTIKPNNVSLKSQAVSNMFKSAYNYSRNNDSHMMKNTEWGAVAYLSHSKYGVNTEVRINNNSGYLTGYAATDDADQSSYPGTYGTDETVTLPYNTTTGYKASTTGNITGVYDMSGGAHEYMASYMSSTSDKSGFTSEELPTYAKYLDAYPNDSTVTSYNNRILGDATGEMGPFYRYADLDGKNRYHNSWYADGPGFVTRLVPWFVRGGHYDSGVLAGQFAFDGSAGGDDVYVGFRMTLTPTN